MYESDQSAVTSALQSSSAAVFTDDTIAKILALTTGTTAGSTVSFVDAAPDANGNVTVPAGAEVIYVKTSDTVQTTVVTPKDAPVIIFQGAGGVSASINDGPTTVPASAAGVVDRVVVGTTGKDKIVIADTKNSLVTIGEGDTVVAGAGSDTIVAGTGNSTIAGGTGHAIVKMVGVASDYVVTVKDGHAVVTNTAANAAVDISKIQFVQLDNGKALVFAKNAQEAAVTTLYETTFGRTADANGLKYWFDAAKSGSSLADIAKGFTNSAEFAATTAKLTDTDFITNLYNQTFSRSAESAGMDYWTAALNQGTTRADMIKIFSEIAGNNIAGTVNTEATVVGSVTVIQDII